MRKSISKEDLLLYFVAIQKIVNRFHKNHFLRLTMIILTFRIKILRYFIFKTKTKVAGFERAIIKKGNFKSFDLKIILGKCF